MEQAAPGAEQPAAAEQQRAPGGGKGGGGRASPGATGLGAIGGPGPRGAGASSRNAPPARCPFRSCATPRPRSSTCSAPARPCSDAFSALGEKERRDLSRLVAEDGDWRVRARNIAAGSLSAGRVGKALAAQQISMARVEDLWPLTLSREEAAERQSRVRSARQRDERRSQRDAEREQRSDRVSRADLEKAQDGRVGAQIRIVIGGQPRDRKRKGDDAPKDEPKTGGSDVLDRLGY